MYMCVEERMCGQMQAGEIHAHNKSAHAIAGMLHVHEFGESMWLLK